jgi:hypothetical protein
MSPPEGIESLSREELLGFQGGVRPVGARGAPGLELPLAGPTPEGPGQPEAARDVAPLPPAGRPAAFPGATRSGTDEQLRGKGAASGSHCPQGTPSTVVEALVHLFRTPRHQTTTA